MIRQIAEWLSQARAAVAFSGAGISTESGIPDFRSPGGIWATSQPVYFDEFLASEQARYEYWRQKAAAQREFASALPNAGHLTIAKWQREARLKAVITQNIDGLHQIGGCSRVLELHGTARFVDCLECQARFDAGLMVERFVAADTPPSCPECGGIMKHATISFGQELPADVLEESAQFSRSADLFLALGSSLVVHPAASLPAIAVQSGSRLVIINRDPTPLDRAADAIVRASIGETLSEIDRELTRLSDEEVLGRTPCD